MVLTQLNTHPRLQEVLRHNGLQKQDAGQLLHNTVSTTIKNTKCAPKITKISRSQLDIWKFMYLKFQIKNQTTKVSLKVIFQLDLK